MNYLAHLFLAPDDPDSRLGNFLGDFVKGSLANYGDHYNQKILMGIQTHRQVDHFTDTHPIFLQSKRRIAHKHHHFSGIIIDIFYDHFLANHWSSFAVQSLESFSEDIYTLLEYNYLILPLKLQNILPRLKQENWLLSYQKIQGIQRSCQRLSRRIKRENCLWEAHQDLIEHYQSLELDFWQFFPELIQFTQNITKSKLNT